MTHAETHEELGKARVGRASDDQRPFVVTGAATNALSCVAGTKAVVAIATAAVAIMVFRTP